MTAPTTARVELRPGYVLHQRPLSDSRKIVDVFTPHSGRITGVLRTGKKTPALLLFQPYLFSWLGRGEFKTFCGYETNGLATTLPGKTLYCAFYLNELLVRLLPPQEEVNALFNLYQNLLQILPLEANIEPHLRHFELLLLRCLGYEYSFASEGFSANPITADGFYSFNAQQGFSRTSPSTPGGFIGSDLLACAEGGESLPVMAVLKRVCRLALAARLGREPLKSRDFFRKS